MYLLPTTSVIKELYLRLCNVTANKELMPSNQAQDQPLAGVRILFVEDVPELKETISEFLVELGAEVIAVSLAKQGLEAIERTKFDLLLSNLSLPEEDGYWLISQIRVRENKLAQVLTPAIALTAAAIEADRARALAAGFQQHVTKPFRMDELSAQIVRLVKPNQ